MPTLLKLVLIGIALAAAFYDLRVRRIPNWVNLTGASLGIALNGYFEGWAGAATAIGGLLVALCVYLPLYALKGMGAGDVKLMAAVGALAGLGNWLLIFITTALLGGLAALALVLWRKRVNQTLLNLSAILGQLAKCKVPAEHDDTLSIQNDKSLKMPHGAVIAAGVGLFLVIHWNA
jgi:prepilin peptidase CpaA